MINVGVMPYFITYQLSDKYNNYFLRCIFWDIVAQEVKFNILSIPYLKRSDCCIIVYDITDLESFKKCESYCKELILNNCKKDVNIMLIGNKIDLENERKVPTEEGLSYANKNNYYFRETTCLDVSTVVDAFETFIIKSFINKVSKDGYE